MEALIIMRCQNLLLAGVILSEKKYTNKYLDFFTSKGNFQRKWRYQAKLDKSLFKLVIIQSTSWALVFQILINIHRESLLFRKKKMKPEDILAGHKRKKEKKTDLFSSRQLPIPRSVFTSHTHSNRISEPTYLA